MQCLCNAVKKNQKYLKGFTFLNSTVADHTYSEVFYRTVTLEICTYRTWTGVSTQLWRFLASGWTLGVDACIVFRVDPLHLTGRLLKWVKAALRALNSHLLVLRDGVQGLDDRVWSLAAACGHLCDTYLLQHREKGHKGILKKTIVVFFNELDVYQVH